MRRYFSSFFIAISFYAFFAVCLFYLMANDKIFIKKAEETKLISINHIELKPEIKEEKKEPEPQTKEIVKEEKIVETPKPITPKKVEKKEIEKKTVEKITEKKVVEKQELEPTKKIQEQVFNKIEEKAPQPLINEKKDYLDKHLAQIRNLINQNVKYPLKAKKLSIEGIVTVRFRINENGTIENITILDGHKFLQSATIEAIEEASKNFPKTNQSIEIQIPIEYKLI
ncbi:MAG: TonB family protein [Aliarcobacter sp.]|nr:TonB family protein [Aliarcobacter sp.]